VSVLLGVGCGSGSSSGKSAAARPSTTATLQIVSPAPNARTGRTVEVRMQLEHAHVVPASQVGGALRADEGHIHLVVDGQLVAMPRQLTDRVTDLPPGPHTIEAEFVASDHVSFANRVVAAVTFVVR
jgi:hypothetical protein